MGKSLSVIQKKQSFILLYEIRELISFFSFEYEIQEIVFFYSGQGSKLLARSYLNEGCEHIFFLFIYLFIIYLFIIYLYLERERGREGESERERERERQSPYQGATNGSKKVNNQNNNTVEANGTVVKKMKKKPINTMNNYRPQPKRTPMRREATNPQLQIHIMLYKKTLIAAHTALEKPYTLNLGFGRIVSHMPHTTWAVSRGVCDKGHWGFGVCYSISISRKPQECHDSKYSRSHIIARAANGNAWKAFA